MAIPTTFRWGPVLAAFVAGAVVLLAGVLLFFDPIASTDTLPERAPVPGPLAFLIYVVLATALFDWAARQMHSPYKAAFLIAASQFILVNVDYVLTGKRGVLTAAASTVLIAVSWASVAAAYSFVWTKTRPPFEEEGQVKE